MEAVLIVNILTSLRRDYFCYAHFEGRMLGSETYDMKNSKSYHSSGPVKIFFWSILVQSPKKKLPNFRVGVLIQVDLDWANSSE